MLQYQRQKHTHELQVAHVFLHIGTEPSGRLHLSCSMFRDQAQPSGSARGTGAPEVSDDRMGCSELGLERN